ncbi:xanthine dehydrogenase family protein molybdopterin-binding subunit [Amycolatopsis minnesotensis]|uniref:Xanthine dehydrogenase family protein molybdopterin-binding subunit n=1 Tax=Amycolatopsis minnesotensis TaxID=337894 RepID=A0ABN2SF95_9PSEU
MSTVHMGGGPPRADAMAKVTGAAAYAADRLPERLAHAALVCAPAVGGAILGIDTTEAHAVAGVLHVMTHLENRPALRRVEPESDLTSGRWAHEDLLPLQGPDIHYAGQIVAVVVAETPEEARRAAGLVAVRYGQAGKPSLPGNFEAVLADAIKPNGMFDAEDLVHGDPAAEIAASSQVVDAVYTTPPEVHAAIEPHGCVAGWEGERLTLNTATQWPVGEARAVAQAVGVDDAQVHLVNPVVGGGFGGKAYFRYHVALCALSARVLDRPVKLVLTREQVCYLGEARPATRQHLVLAAGPDGRLRAITHDSFSAVSRVGTGYGESTGDQTPVLYSTRALRVTHRVVPFDMATTCPMRAPGVGPGSFAVESAMDELAVRLGLDPLELRLRCYSEHEQGTGRPFSAKHLRECYDVAARRIGWSSRSPVPAARRRGDWLIGLGMATASFYAIASRARAAVALLADGTAEVRSSANDIGTGSSTVYTQLAAARLGLPMDRMRQAFGDNTAPAGSIAAGQSQAGSVGPAVAEAEERVVARIARLAVEDAASPLAGLAGDQVDLADGRVFARDEPALGEEFATVLARHGLDRVVAEAEFRPPPSGGSHSLQCWGAQFVEVGVRASSGEVRVRRVASAFDFGQVLNTRTARNQLVGGIVFGIGAALLERGDYDPHAGSLVNASLAEYLVATHADVPEIDVTMVNRPDFVANPRLGAKGCGEIGNVGIAAAIANAVFNATGVRVRDLPVRPETILRRIDPAPPARKEEDGRAVSGSRSGSSR